MKKIAIILLALTLINSMSFAQTTTTAKKSVAEQTKEVVGKVVSVTLADPAKGIASGAITVGDEMGKIYIFTIKSTVKIFDSALNAITLNQLNIGEKVKIEESKTNEAKSINVIK